MDPHIEHLYEVLAEKDEEIRELQALIELMDIYLLPRWYDGDE